MKILFSTLKKGVIALCLGLMLVACSKLTQTNYERVQAGMSMREVVAILGEPTSSESISVAGISGTSAVWKDKNTEIDIQFLNDKVTVKTLGNPGEQKPQQAPGG